MWNLDIWMQKPRACSLPFLKCTAWAFKPRLPRRKTLYHPVSILSFFINWQRIMVCTFLICDADSVCFSHDHFHCQLRTCMFWSQTCNEKVDGLEIRQGMSCSGCLGPLCEEINHLSVANRIASHIWWSAAYYIYMCISLSTPPACRTYCSLKRRFVIMLELCCFCSFISLIRRRVWLSESTFSSKRHVLPLTILAAELHLHDSWLLNAMVVCTWLLPWTLTCITAAALGDVKFWVPWHDIVWCLGD